MTVFTHPPLEPIAECQRQPINDDEREKLALLDLAAFTSLQYGWNKRSRKIRREISREQAAIAADPAYVRWAIRRAFFRSFCELNFQNGLIWLIIY
jgi:hypothetical protein